MTSVKMTKPGETAIYVDSGQVSAHQALGWIQAEIDYDEHDMVVPYGDSVDFEAGSALKIAGIPVTASAAELNELAGQVSESARIYVQHYQTAPDAASATYVHAEIPLSDAEQDIATAITNPDVPRIATIKGNVSGLTGDVVLTGTNIDDEAITDTIALNGASEVLGVVAFKTITNVHVPAETHAPDTAQQETATVVGTITGDGNADVVVTAANMENSPVTVHVAVSQGILQVETATVVGEISSDGDAEVIVTADGMNNSPKTVAVAVLAGTAQVETATAVGTVTGAGYADVVVTSADIPESPVTAKVYVEVDDTASIVATKIRAELNTHSEITDVFTVGGSSADVTLTANAAADNDATLNISIDNDTCTGLTTAATSADTTPGVAPDDASAVATKIKTALGLESDITDFFTISGSGADVVLTAKTEAADDATMNISIDNDTCAGLTTAATSADTTAGVAPDDADAVAAKIIAALQLDADVSGFFDIDGSGADVVLTALQEASNDATMNVSIDNGTCTGLTTAATSADTTAGVYDTVSVGIGNKFGLPHIVDYAGLLLIKLFDGSADSGTLAVDDDEIEKNLYAINGTPDGLKLLDLYYLA